MSKDAQEKTAKPAALGKVLNTSGVRPKTNYGGHGLSGVCYLSSAAAALYGVPPPRLLAGTQPEDPHELSSQAAIPLVDRERRLWRMPTSRIWREATGSVPDSLTFTNRPSAENGRDRARVQGRSSAIFSFIHPGGDNRSRASPLRESC
jgi:hypothetical protein